MILSIIGTLVGGILIIFGRKFAQLVIESQNKMWGFHFGKRELLITSILSFIIGAVLVVLNLSELIRTML